MIEYILNVNPTGKPRMVRSDKWKNRSTVNHYWAFKDELVLEKNRIGMPGLKDKLEITFYIQIPRSWSDKKKKEMNGKPHQQKPDLDNCIKGVLDIFLEQDNFIYSIKAEKYWSEKGFIKIVM